MGGDWLSERNDSHYAGSIIQDHRFWYQSKAHLRLPITSYLAQFPRYGWLLVKFSLVTGDRVNLTLSWGMVSCEYPDKLYLSRNQNDCFIWCRRPYDRIFIPLDKTLECDGRTDGRPHGRTGSTWLLQRSALRAMRTRCKILIELAYIYTLQ